MLYIYGMLIYKRRNSYNISGIQNKEWWKIIEEARQVASIKQKIGTHGLRKTMAYQYITNIDDKNTY